MHTRAQALALIARQASMQAGRGDAGVQVQAVPSKLVDAKYM